MSNVDDKSFKRASNSMICLPFNLQFYSDIKNKGLSASEVFERDFIYSKTLNGWFSNSNALEDTFRWMIKIGILRREVDGQGLTSKVRLTPLGRIVVETCPSLFQKNPGLLGLFSFWLSRYSSVI